MITKKEYKLLRSELFDEFSKFGLNPNEINSIFNEIIDYNNKINLKTDDILNKNVKDVEDFIENVIILSYYGLSIDIDSNLIDKFRKNYLLFLIKYLLIIIIIFIIYLNKLTLFL